MALNLQAGALGRETNRKMLPGSGPDRPPPPLPETLSKSLVWAESQNVFSKAVWEMYREEKEQRQRIKGQHEKYKPSGNIQRLIFNGIMAQANDNSFILSLKQYLLSKAFMPSMAQLARTSSWEPIMLWSVQLLIHWRHVGSLKLAMGGTFTHRNQQMLQIRVLSFSRVWNFFLESWSACIPLVRHYVSEYSSKLNSQDHNPCRAHVLGGGDQRINWLVDWIVDWLTSYFQLVNKALRKIRQSDLISCGGWKDFFKEAMLEPWHKYACAISSQQSGVIHRGRDSDLYLFFSFWHVIVFTMGLSYVVFYYVAYKVTTNNSIIVSLAKLHLLLAQWSHSFLNSQFSNFTPHLHQVFS